MTRCSHSPFAGRPQSADLNRSSSRKRPGCGLSGQRHRKSLKTGAEGVSKPALRRLARKAGVKRIAVDTYAEARGALDTFLKTVLKDVSSITESARRMTVTVPDVLFALKRNGRTLYGFGEINSLEQYAHRLRKPVRSESLQRARVHVGGSRTSAAQELQQPSTPASVPQAGSSMRHKVDMSSSGAAEQSAAGSSPDMIPTTPNDSNEGSEVNVDGAMTPMSQEMRDHIQGSVGEYVSKVYQYDPPGSVYKVKDLHSWVSSNYFQRKGLPQCSPEQLHTILYALDEEGQVMISSDTNDLQIRFVM